MLGKMPRAPKHRRILTLIITKLVSRLSRHEIENSSSIRELGDLLIIKNHFMMFSSFPEVRTAFQLFVTIPVTTASVKRSFSNLSKKFYGTRKVMQLSYSIHRTFHGRKCEL